MRNLTLVYHDVCPVCGNARIACEGSKGKWYLYCVNMDCIENAPRVYKSLALLNIKNTRKVAIESSLLVTIVERICPTCGCNITIAQPFNEPPRPDVDQGYFCANPECDAFYELDLSFMYGRDNNE